MLVLTDKSGHKEIQRKQPGVVSWRGQREGKSKNLKFLKITFLVGWRTKKKFNFRVADSFFSKGKV